MLFTLIYTLVILIINKKNLISYFNIDFSYFVSVPDRAANLFKL